MAAPDTVAVAQVIFTDLAVRVMIQRSTPWALTQREIQQIAQASIAAAEGFVAEVASQGVT